MRKKSKLKCEMIWKIWKRSKLKSEKIWKIWRKSKLNSEKRWKIWKISVLVIITPKETSSSSRFFVFILLFNGYLFVYLSVCFMFSLFFSVSNFYFTSQYHQFPLSHPADRSSSIFLSHTHHHHQQQQQPYIPEQQQPPPLLKFLYRFLFNFFFGYF